MTQKHGKAPLFFLMLLQLSGIFANVAAASEAPTSAGEDRHR